MMAAENTWNRDGLPDECPECGEREELSARIHRFDEQLRAETATVICEACSHEWHWGRRMGVE
jgi:DNA-directed RNA polymerase subunit M/transcription elongation factor TFIIS